MQRSFIVLGMRSLRCYYFCDGQKFPQKRRRPISISGQKIRKTITNPVKTVSISNRNDASNYRWCVSVAFQREGQRLFDFFHHDITF